MQWSAILRFAVNFAAENGDIGWLERRHLFLDASIPYCQLPRHKTGEHRCTPLLPETVAAIKRWMEFSKIAADHVFATRRGRRFEGDKVSHGYHDLLTGCATLPGIEEKLRFDRIDVPEEQRKGWDFKHIRNVGPNLARDHGLRDRVSALLGHVPDKKNADFAYLDVHDERFLIPVVNLIGEEYLGEQIAMRPRLQVRRAVSGDRTSGQTRSASRAQKVERRPGRRFVSTRTE